MTFLLTRAARQCAGITMALATIAAPGASWAHPQDARSDARVREAALWRAAALQSDVVGGQRREPALLRGYATIGRV